MATKLDEFIAEVKAFDYRWFDEIGGNDAIGELQSLREQVAQANTGLQTDTAKRCIEVLAWIVIEYASKGYISGNDIDLANDLLNKAQLELRPRRAAKT